MQPPMDPCPVDGRVRRGPHTPPGTPPPDADFTPPKCKSWMPALDVETVKAAATVLHAQLTPLRLPCVDAPSYVRRGSREEKLPSPPRSNSSRPSSADCPVVEVEEREYAWQVPDSPDLPDPHDHIAYFALQCGHQETPWAGYADSMEVDVAELEWLQSEEVRRVMQAGANGMDALRRTRSTAPVHVAVEMKEEQRHALATALGEAQRRAIELARRFKEKERQREEERERVVRDRTARMNRRLKEEEEEQERVQIGLPGKSFSPPRSDVSVERSPSPAADMIKVGPKTPPPQLKVNLPKPAPVVVTLEESPMPVRSSPIVETKHNPTAQIIHNTTFKVGLNSDDDMPKRVVRNAEVSVLPPPPAPPALAAQPAQPKPAARFVPIATPQTPVAAAPASVAVAPTPVAPAAVASPLPAVLQRMSGSAAASSGGVASRFPLSARVFADLKQFQDQVIAGVRPEKKEELGGLRLSALSTGGAGDNTLEKMMGRERMLETLSEVQMERFIAKKRQLEQQFKQDCETYAFVSKKLLSKDDSLASQLRMALIEVVEDMETQLMEKVDACLETISLC